MTYTWEYRVVKRANDDGDRLYEVMHVWFADGRPLRAISGEPGQAKSVGRLLGRLELMMAAAIAAIDADDVAPDALVIDESEILDVPSRARVKV